MSDERLGEPRTNRDLLGLLVRGGWLTAPEAEPLANMIGFRNVLVHGYGEVEADDGAFRGRRRSGGHETPGVS